MTTATDWDVRDRETNDELSVTDVQAALNLDGAATEVEPVDVHELAEALARQTQQTDMLAAENAELRRRLGGWEPRRDPDSITSAADLTEREYNAGLYRPAELDDTDDEGMPLHPIGSSTTWPTWLGGLHHADATLAEQIGGLRSWADTYAAPPVERTVVEPVEIDTSYRETEAWALADMVLAGRDHETGDVLAGPYSQLAPERIQETPPSAAQARVDNLIAHYEQRDEQALVPTGAPDEHDPPQHEPEPTHSNGDDAVPTPSDDRVQRMAEGRRRRDTLATRSSDDDAVTTPQRRPWWRREWVAATGVGVMWAGFMAYAVAHAMGVLA